STTAWGASYWHLMIVEHTSDGRDGICCSVECGTVVLKKNAHNGSQFDVRAWLGHGRLVDAYTRPLDTPYFSKWYPMCQLHVMGFALGWRIPAEPEWMVMVPLWFITGAFALLLWFIWRKTRNKVAGRAFPVEIG